MSSSPDPPSPHDNSDVPNAQLSVPSSPQPRRNRSVQFSMSVSPKSRSYDQLPEIQHHAESSADEITPIAGRERGGQRNYDTTGKGTGSETAGGTSKGSRTATRRRASRASSRHSEGGDSEEEAGGWWHKLVDKYGSIELDNKGSVARDHLALERTFLAWLRTSLAFASIGVAITQLFRLNATISEREGLKPQPTNVTRLRHMGKPLGATFLGISILILIVGGRRYFESQYWIIRGKFPASRGSIFLVTLITAALIITSLVVVCVINPTVFER